MDDDDDQITLGTEDRVFAVKDVDARETCRAPSAVPAAVDPNKHGLAGVRLPLKVAGGPDAECL